MLKGESNHPGEASGRGREEGAECRMLVTAQEKEEEGILEKGQASEVG